MTGSASAFQGDVTISITLYENSYIPRTVPIERVIFSDRIDEETRDYLREKAFVERMTARRLFRDDD